MYILLRYEINTHDVSPPFDPGKHQPGHVRDHKRTRRGVLKGCSQIPVCSDGSGPVSARTFARASNAAADAQALSHIHKEVGEKSQREARGTDRSYSRHGSRCAPLIHTRTLDEMTFTAVAGGSEPPPVSVLSRVDSALGGLRV